MSFSNPMHRDSALHPIMQEALAPFAPKGPMLTDEQRSMLDSVDFSIRMFAGYGKCYEHRAEELRAARVLLLQYFAGEIDRDALPYVLRDKFLSIPADMLGS